MSNYEQWQNSFLLERVPIGRWLAAAGMVAFVPLDSVVYPEQLDQLVLIRILGVLLLASTLLLDHTTFGKRHPYLILLFIPWAANLPIAHMTVITEGISSSYYLGMVLVHIGMVAIFPVRWRMHIVAQLGTIIYYIGANQILGTTEIAQKEVFENLFFVFWFFFLGDVSIYLYEILHKQNYASQDVLESAYSQLSERERLKSSFFVRQNDRLRDLLEIVVNRGNDLETQAAKDNLPHYEKFLRSITRANYELQSIIIDFLDMSLVETGKLQLHYNNFSVKEMLQNILGDLATHAESHKAQIRISYSDKLGVIRSDPKRVQQAIRTILLFAIKSTENGKIAIETKREERDGTDWITIVIDDNGIGMAPEQRARFFLSYMPDTSNMGGSGLQPSLARMLCRLLGGDIEVGGKLGKGTTFTIRLPSEAPDPYVDVYE